MHTTAATPRTIPGNNFVLVNNSMMETPSPKGQYTTTVRASTPTKKTSLKRSNDLSMDNTFDPLVMLVLAASNRSATSEPPTHAHPHNVPLLDATNETKSSAIQRQSPLPVGWKDELLYMPTKELNRYLKEQEVPPDTVMKLKIARRRIKNRIYTRQSRNRKATRDGDSTPPSTPSPSPSPSPHPVSVVATITQLSEQLRSSSNTQGLDTVRS
eukprot:m.257264 g.257264  ORF g.257264 m.257264 type:complete len:213 (-) comp35108_c0_seq1:129-767(-)